MNSDSHLQDADLLRYLDGELETSHPESIKAHLDACWSCRMRAGRIENAIVEYARHRERSRAPSPPAPWKDLTDDFRRVDERTRIPSLWERILAGVTMRASRAALISGAALVVAAAWLIVPRTPTSESAQPSVAAPVIAPLPPRSPTPVPTPRQPKPREAPATASEELAIVAELHRIGADLGEPIELERAPDGRLALAASGLSQEREQAIRTAMAPFLHLRLRFSQFQAFTGHEVEPARAAPRPIAFEEELLRFFGSKRHLEQFTNSVLDASDRALMQAQALKKLDDRFANAGLNTEERALLESIRHDHEAAVERAAQELHRLLEPVLQFLKVEEPAAFQGTLLQAALETDRLLNAALAGAHSNLSDRDLYRELKGCVSRLLN